MPFKYTSDGPAGVRSSTLKTRILRAAAACMAVLTAATAHAEFVRVSAANTVGNSVYDVTAFAPPPGVTTPLNSDGASHGSFSSLVHVANLAAGTVDVLVADAVRGQIIRYTPAVGLTPKSESVVWSASPGVGPAHPDGLSVDAAGNLFIVTSKLNDNTTSSVWVLPPSAASPTGYAATPLLIDATFTSAFGVKVLEETVIAVTTTAAWSAGDLLVLVGNGSSSNAQPNTNDADVLVYRAASIAGVLAGQGPRNGPDQVILAPSQFPAGEFPLGMDFWPPDAISANTTLLLTTTAGRILRYDFSAPAGVVVATLKQVFASGLGSGLHKVKVGLQFEVPYAYVTQAPSKSSGRILQLGAPVIPGTTNLIGAATQGVNSPDGLSVARASAVPANSCVAPNTCDISGGVVPHQIKLFGGAQAPTPTGNSIESTCLVLADPRVNINSGVCDGTTLNVAKLCPGFGNEIVPGTMCGGSGDSKTGFALVRNIAQGVDGLSPIFIYTQENVDQILPPALGAQNPPCPSAVIAWGPRSDAIPSEGSIVEIDPVTGFTELVEMTGYCDSSGSGIKSMSIYGVGLTLNANALNGGLVGFAKDKYNNLFSTVDRANIASATKTALEASLAQLQIYLNEGNYGCAAVQTLTVESQVLNDPDPVHNYPGNAANPNPWGEIRGRLANLFLTLNTRILGKPANSSWPPGPNDTLPKCVGKR